MIYTEIIAAYLLTEKNKNKRVKPNLGKEKPFETTSINKKQDFISWVVFLFSVSIVIITLISVIFPALIVSNNSTLIELKELDIIRFDVDPFTTGVWAGPLLVTNIVVFALTFFYFKKKLPYFVTKSIDLIFNFEVSKKLTIFAIVILLGIYVAFSVNELTEEETWEDYPAVKKRLDNWSPEQITSGFEPHVKYFMHWLSMKLFGYYTIIPFFCKYLIIVIDLFFHLQNYK